MSGKRLLGIDYGTKRIGVSISDEGGTLAFPKEIIENDSNVFEKIGELINTENISEIVVGESIDFKGKENQIMKDLKEFVIKVEAEFGLPVHLEKEFLTSVEARRYDSANLPTRHTKKIPQKADASAAALILQRYLDKNNQK